MSTRTIIIIFAVIFLAGVLLIVVLPLILGEGPVSVRRESGGRQPPMPERGVFRSDDGGRTWQAKVWIEGDERSSIAAFHVNQLLPDPIDSSTLYLLTDGNGLWVSKSRGELWAQVRDGAGALEPSANVLDLAVNPADRLEWHVAVFQQNRGRVLASADGGRTFREIYFTPVERFGVFGVGFDTGRGTVRIATGQGGLIESGDQGRTWRVVRWFADGLIRLMISPVDSAVQFVATPRGSLFRTQDHGATWTDVSENFSAMTGTRSQQRWFMDASGTLYLGSRHGLLLSRDRGASFQAPPLLIPPDALPILAIAVDPRAGSHIAVSAGHQLHVSRDGGRSWSILSSPLGKPVSHLAIDRERSEVMYAVVEP